MPYEIIKYNGSPLVVINDGTINTSATSLQLVGKGVATYGEAIAEDLVHLLEHCTSPTEPTNPIVGQVWNHLDAGGTGVHILKVCKSESPVVWDAIIQASGGTMTGSLMLAHDPVQPLEAATKRYIDSRSNFTGLLDVPHSYTAGGAGPGWVPIINSTMTGLEWGLAAGTGGGTVADLVIEHHGGGGVSTSNALLITVENFTGTGSQTVFTLTSTIGSQNRINVYVDGIYQTKNTFVLTGTTLTFTEAPMVGSVVEVEILSIVTQGTTTLATNSTLNVNIDRFTGNGSTVVYTLTHTTLLNYTNVFVDGVYQDKDSYTISGTTLTFTEAPMIGSIIEIEGYYITGTANDALTINIDRFTSTGTAYTLAGATTLNNTDVYVSGLYQDKSTYTVSGTTLTFSAAPPTGTIIEVVRHSFVAGVGGSGVSGVTNELLITVENFAGTGSQTAFTITSTIGSQNRINVYLDGLYQDKNTYNLSGATLTFTEAPPNGTIIEVEIMSIVNQGTTTLATNSTLNVNIDRYIGNGSTDTYTLTHSFLLNYTNVYINGAYQNKDSYTVSGTTLTFTQIPPNNSDIEVEGYYITGTANDTLTINVDSFTSSGTTYTMAGSSTLNNTDVYVSGLYQDKNSYTVSGTTLALSTAPINGLSIEVVRHSFVAGTSGSGISGGPGATELYKNIAIFIGDGLETVYTLPNTLATQNTANVYLSGVYQDKNSYTISGTTLTFISPPPSGDAIEVEMLAIVNTGTTTLASNSTLNGTIGRYTSDGVATTYTLSQSSSTSMANVYISGLYQYKNTYTISGTTLTLSSAPPNGSIIEVECLSITGAAGDTLILNSDYFTSNGVTYTLAHSTTLGMTDLYIAGVYQNKNAYTVSGTTLTLTTAPNNGLLIEVTSYAFTSGTSGGSGISSLNDLYKSIDTFMGTGSQTVFTLSRTSSFINVFISGVYQDKDTYTVSGTTLTFISAPPAGNTINVEIYSVIVFGTTTNSSNSTISLNVERFNGNGVLSTFVLSTTPSSINALGIFIDGLYQDKSLYSLVSNNITFVTPPPTGTVIEVGIIVISGAAGDTLNYTTNSFTGDGLLTTYTLTLPSTTLYTDVYISGLYQDPTTYTVSGTTLTFSAAPLDGGIIDVIIEKIVSNSTSGGGGPGTVEWNLMTASTGFLGLTEDVTLHAPTHQIRGNKYTLVVNQAGNHAVTFDPAYKFQNGVVPTISQGANKTDIFTFLSNGTNLLGISSQNF